MQQISDELVLLPEISVIIAI